MRRDVPAEQAWLALFNAIREVPPHGERVRILEGGHAVAIGWRRRAEE
jgi:hypothetical protein